MWPLPHHRAFTWWSQASKVGQYCVLVPYRIKLQLYTQEWSLSSQNRVLKGEITNMPLLTRLSTPIMPLKQKKSEYLLKCLLSSPKWSDKQKHKPLQLVLMQGGPRSQSGLLWVTQTVLVLCKWSHLTLWRQNTSVWHATVKNSRCLGRAVSISKGWHKTCICRACFFSLDNFPQWKWTEVMTT